MPATETIERRKPAGEITDRQRRRRARAIMRQTGNQKRCLFCGSSRNIRVHHLNGNESDEDPSNLGPACHSCNVRIGWTLRRSRIGRPVDLEYKNPDAKPARNLAQWVMAVKSLHGESSDMTARQAIAMIRATPAWRRSQFAGDIWKLRYAAGTDKTGVPF